MEKDKSIVKSTFTSDPIELSQKLESIAGELLHHRIAYTEFVLLEKNKDEADATCLLFASQIIQAASIIKFLFKQVV